jgi:hypothetical protein
MQQIVFMCRTDKQQSEMDINSLIPQHIYCSFDYIDVAQLFPTRHIISS